MAEREYLHKIILEFSFGVYFGSKIISLGHRKYEIILEIVIAAEK